MLLVSSSAAVMILVYWRLGLNAGLRLLLLGEQHISMYLASAAVYLHDSLQ